MTGRDPLLPALRDRPGLDAAVRSALSLLRDRLDDPGLRDRVDAVLADRASLRDLARDPGFSARLAPLVEQGRRHWAALPAADRAALASALPAEGRREVDRPLADG